MSFFYIVFVKTLINVLIDNSYEDKCTYNLKKDNQELDDWCKTQKNKYRQMELIISIMLGILALANGLIIPKSNKLAKYGLSLGGAFVLIQSSWKFWYDIPDEMKLLISSATLGILIYSGKDMINA